MTERTIIDYTEMVDLDAPVSELVITVLLEAGWWYRMVSDQFVAPYVWV